MRENETGPGGAKEAIHNPAARGSSQRSVRLKALASCRNNIETQKEEDKGLILIR
jgi:hypothetical protein